jgi:ADP-ribose pyrophosphatase
MKIKKKNKFKIFKGMNDPGELISQTLKREFMEEATNSLEASETERKKNEEYLTEFFENGKEVYY